MSERLPTVSVCVSTFEHAAFIERCVRSVLDQQAKCIIEVLVGDDGSMDGTRDLVLRLAHDDPRVKPMFHAMRLGPSGNLSSLVAAAAGDFIAHLDGDDYWLPGKLAAQLECFERVPNASAVYTNAQVVAPDGRLLGVFNRGIAQTIDRHELLRRGNFLCHSTLLYRCGAANAVRAMRSPYIDYRIHLRLLAFGDLAYVDEPLVAYRWRTPGSMVTTLPVAVVSGHIDAFAEALVDGAAPRDVRAAAGRVFGRALIQCLLCGRVADALKPAAALRAIPHLRADGWWFLAQTLLAPLRAADSLLSRRRGVYFP